MKNSKDRLFFEKKLWKEGYNRIMGLDEVGRGCLAGPVVAAGVILSDNNAGLEEVRDSKQLSEPKRKALAEKIKSRSMFWTIKECSIKEINELNILWASIRAMEKCVEDKGASPEYLLVDGNRYGSSLIPYTCLTKGDDRSLSIGAASILAKVYRDELMKGLHDEYPMFGWDSNVGYPTAQHRKALMDHGITRYHRESFNLGTEQKYGASKRSNDK